MASHGKIHLEQLIWIRIDIFKWNQYKKAMPVEIFINVRPYQTRVACVEKGSLKKISYHRSQFPSLVGALYKGRVTKITKSLNYAFVDLGLERAGFLYGKDLPGKTKEVAKFLKTGQEVLVQVKADPLRNKGVRLRMEIGLAGLYLVYLPEQRTKTTLSRQIANPEERKKLNEIVKSFNEPGALIVRTFAQGQKEEELKKDLEHLKGKWIKIQEAFQKQKGPGQIQKGEEPLLVFLRDTLSLEADRFIVDEKETFTKVKKWIKVFRPNLAKKVELYKEAEPLYKKFNLESQMQRTQQKKVPLKNGGFLIFEELEAFSVIDVNSGRFSGNKSLSKSLLNLNLEAAKVIAEQVQLRHLGGIILVDFIDMEEQEDRKRVVARLEKGFKGDKFHPKVFPMGELGMVQITRKRSENSLSHFMTEVCPSCKGQGRKKSLPTIANDLFLKVENFTPSGFFPLRKKQKVRIACHPKIKSYIEEQEKESLEFFNKKLSLSLLLEESPKLEPENFRMEKL